MSAAGAAAAGLVRKYVISSGSLTAVVAAVAIVIVIVVVLPLHPVWAQEAIGQVGEGDDRREQEGSDSRKEV